MRAVVQRVTRASVVVDGAVVGAIDRGLMVLLGAGQGDGEEQARFLADRVVGLRIFEDEQGRMNRALSEVGGALLLVSQFTLYCDVRRGRRPSFVDALEPEKARELMEVFAEAVRELGILVQTGIFGARMEVELINAGPVTLILDTEDWNRPRRDRERGETP
jgi:D-aminoacyl-tRNA deacylase